MEKSPFIYGTTVSRGAFTNREGETKKLYNNLTQGINTTIISPRRWGKSSLVEKVVIKIKKTTTIKVVLIDLFSVSNEEEFLNIFAKEIIKASSNKWEDWINSSKLFFKQLIPKISFGIDPTNDFSISFDWQELNKYKSEILNLAETIALKKNIRFIICLDEFQNLATFNDFEFFEKKMRAIWQRQKNTTYCLYGSKQHMMQNIFNNPSKPFYRFGDILHLTQIKTEKWTDFILENFKKTNKQISKKYAKLIPLIMNNHSWYVQQFANYTWQNTSEKVSKAGIKKALNELIYANLPLYQREIELLSTKQINLLKAISKKESKFTSIAVMQKYQLGTPNNVSKNIKSLTKNNLIHKVELNLVFLDPAFEIWFNQQFFNKKYIQNLIQ